MISRTGRALVLVGAAAWLAIPCIALAILWQHASSASLTVPTASWVTVEAPPDHLTREADLALKWSDDTPLLAPAWNGIVQQVSLLPGDDLRSGSAVCVINGVTRLAWISDVPLFRPIGYGDRGQDVAALNQLLSQRGLPHDEGDYAGWRTVQGIKRFAESIGAGRPSVFDPAWLVFLSSASEVSDIELVVGAPAPPAGAVIVTMAPQLLGATVTETDPLRQEGPSPTDSATPMVKPARLAPGESVWIGEMQLELTSETSQIADTSLNLIRDAVQPDQSRTQVTVFTPIPPLAVAIPYGAVAAIGDQSCVLRRRGTETEVVRVVTLLPGLGRTYVSGPLRVGDEVRVPPPSTPACP